MAPPALFDVNVKLMSPKYAEPYATRQQYILHNIRDPERSIHAPLTGTFILSIVILDTITVELMSGDVMFTAHDPYDTVTLLTVAVTIYDIMILTQRTEVVYAYACAVCR